MVDVKTESFADAETKFKALLGLETLNTFDQTLFRHALKQYFRKGFDAYAWPEFTFFGEALTLNASKKIRIYNDQNTSPGSYESVVGIGNVDSILNVFKQDPDTNFNAREYIFFETISDLGSRCVQLLTNDNVDGQVVYVSYKADFEYVIKNLVVPNSTTGFFGSGSGDCDVIPVCLFDYIIQGAYVQYLKSDGQNQKSILEEQVADKLLQESINKFENTGKQYRNNLATERPRSQFNRHNYSQVGQIILPGQGGQQG